MIPFPCIYQPHGLHSVYGDGVLNMPKRKTERKSGHPGKVAVFSTRIEPNLRARLEASAVANKRSLTQEIEDRLRRSFGADDARQQLIATFGTRQNFAVCRLIANVMAHV